MLKTYLSRQGLALESGEVVDGEVTVIDQVASADELTEQHEAIASDSADLDAAEESEATLESLVLLMSNSGRTFTSLESALINEKIAFAYSNIGLSTESLSLESDTVALSMEGIGEIIAKIKEAISNGYEALKGKVKDFLSWVMDHCGRSAKLFAELKNNLKGDEIKVTPNAAKRWKTFAAGLGDVPVVRVFSDIEKASKMLLVDYVKSIAEGIHRVEADFTSKAKKFLGIPLFLDANLYFEPTALGKKVKFDHLKLPKSPQVTFSGTSLIFGGTANTSYHLRLTPGNGTAYLPDTISVSDLAQCCGAMSESLKMASAYARDWRGRAVQLDKLINQVNDARARRKDDSYFATPVGGFKKHIKWSCKRLNEHTTHVPREWISYLVNCESVLLSFVGFTDVVKASF